MVFSCAAARHLLPRMDILEEIIETRRARLNAAKDAQPLAALQRDAYEIRAIAKPKALTEALHLEGINIIAEFKRRSPSKGVIRADATPIQIAKSYQAGGAIAMSVLTEEDYFAGSLADLREVKSAVPLPVLRKDFVFDEYQVFESAAVAADAILLIVAALDDDLLLRLRRLAEDELRMDALVEVHNSEEMKRAANCGANLIGVNNRDLRSFTVSLDTSLSLAPDAPDDALLISESGLNTPDDLKLLRAAGYSGFLIGESLMRTPEPEKALRNLIQIG